MHSTRVDGNDVLAMYQATAEARRLAVESNKPVLIEAMTYRVGHHSTSDDSSSYRHASETEKWLSGNNPIARFKLFLANKGFWDDASDESLKTECKKDVLEALKKAESLKKPDWRLLFTDVYETMPESLRDQLDYMEKHVQEYAEHYPLESHRVAKDSDIK